MLLCFFRKCNKKKTQQMRESSIAYQNKRMLSSGADEWIQCSILTDVHQCFQLNTRWTHQAVSSDKHKQSFFVLHCFNISRWRLLRRFIARSCLIHYIVLNLSLCSVLPFHWFFQPEHCNNDTFYSTLLPWKRISLNLLNSGWNLASADTMSRDGG